MSNEIYQARSTTGYLIHASRNMPRYPSHTMPYIRSLVNRALCGRKRDASGWPTLQLLPLLFTADLQQETREAYDGTLMKKYCPKCLAAVRRMSK